ncbi:hypothetical protein ACQKKX_04930 [Neorhizobium sp. NPDC001467]|uniref:hypothetical protein n=1 Tax=Neorhizobium sp. NPDC001467 TaxID=3390595 RepID=UPI003CFEF61B
MSTPSFSGRKFLIGATYAATIILFASIAWQPGSTTLDKSSRLSGSQTETAFLMQRFGNPQRTSP